MSSEARTAVLAAIRDALASATPPTLPEPALLAPPVPSERLRLFADTLRRAGGEVLAAADDDAVAPLVHEILAGRHARRVAVSDHPRCRRLGERLRESGLDVVPADAGRAALLGCDAGISGAQHGIAETGSLLLESRCEQHRLVSLLPPLHVAILEEGLILGTLDEALASVRPAEPAAMSRAITLVTGPSRTADIELSLVIGVHGPAELHVVVIEDRNP